MKQYLTILALILSLSCNDNSNNRIHIIEDNNRFEIPSISISIIDTIHKYESTDSVYIDFNSNKGELREWFFLGKINDSKFAIHWPIEFENLYLYQFVNNKWELTDTIKDNHADHYEFKRIDLNFDGYMDLLIGQVNCLGLIYDPNKKKLKFDSIFNLPKIQIDKGKKIIRTFSQFEKCRYTFSKNRLELKDGIKIFSDNYYDTHKYNPNKPYENIDTLKFFSINNGRKIYQIVKFDTEDKIIERFHKMLWDSNNSTTH